MADKRVVQPIKIVDPTDTNEAAVPTLADALANPAFSLSVAAANMAYNGATWDRLRDRNINADGLAAPAYALDTGSFGMLWNGATWDRMPGAAATGLVVNTELPAAAALADAAANPTTPTIGAALLFYNGATWDRARGAIATGLLVDTELPAAAVLANGMANPTVPGVGAFMMGWNTATWDRVLVDAGGSGRLQVDVISGGGETLPTGQVIEDVTTAALAAGASIAMNGAELGAAGSTYYLSQVDISSSVAFKAVIAKVINAAVTQITILFGQAGVPLTWRPPNRRYVPIATTAGADNWRVTVTNMDTSQAADFYATFYHQTN